MPIKYLKTNTTCPSAFFSFNILQWTKSPGSLVAPTLTSLWPHLKPCQSSPCHCALGCNLQWTWRKLLHIFYKLYCAFAKSWLDFYTFINFLLHFPTLNSYLYYIQLFWFILTFLPSSIYHFSWDHTVLSALNNSLTSRVLQDLERVLLSSLWWFMPIHCPGWSWMEAQHFLWSLTFHHSHTP